MKDENRKPYLSFKEWQSSRSTFAINPGAQSIIREMYQDYVKQRLEEQAQYADANFYCLEEEDKVKCKTQCPFCERV